MNRNVQLTWSFVEEISKAKDVDAVRGVVKALAAQYGMETAFGGVIPQDFSTAGDLSKLILVADLPLDWIARYFRNDYVRRDPIIAFANNDLRHYSWNDAYRAYSNKEDVKVIQGEAGAFGMREGFVVPVRMLDGNSAVMSFGGQRVEISPEDQRALSFATNYAIGQLVYQQWQPAGEIRSLSPRETDCLFWAAEGKSDWEVSVILGVGVSTVEKHMTSARDKLKAVNKGHAIAKALRCRLIH